MTYRYTRAYDQAQALIDTINHDSDPHERLSNLQRLTNDLRRMLVAARDEAAYDLRSRYSSEDAEQIAGISRRFIDYWARRWRVKHDLPGLMRKRQPDLAQVIDLSNRH